MPSQHPTYAAIDFGASSGRVLTGTIVGGQVDLTEHHRFANTPVRLPGGLHWNLLNLFSESVGALRGMHHLRGIGVDTWAVDYGLLDARHELLGLPFHYRDGRSDALVGEAFDRVSRAEQYAIAGIQTLPFNTIFQLLADQDGPALSAATRLAMVPDLIGLWLTGELANERTNASTTGLLDARTGDWSEGLIQRIGLPTQLFTELVDPGHRLGPTLPHLDVGSVPVYTVASHDTASAFVGAPIVDDHCAVLSSGTWSLLGLELPAPVLTEAAQAADLTNERGIDGTTRLLKNVMGLWLEQECSRTWGIGHAELFALATQSTVEAPLFDPDRPEFLQPGDMPRRIAEACVDAGQAAPEGAGGTVRSILTSLACKYRYVLELLEQVSGREIRRIHVIGGGSQVALLCRLTADITGREVLAGPVEATAIGNVLVQARADGELGSLADIRAVAAASAHPEHFEPSADQAASESTYQRFLAVTGLSQPALA
ncbi:MAG: rhamnulokinase family protein [Solirubrobacteraceae bacterium]|nr:rhamnulokinase family protein [Patulibacter sp.]